MVTADTHRLLKTLDAALQPRAEILDAYLFGSTATGATHLHSDVDVAVYLANRRPTGSVFGYTADLAAVLMSVLGTNRVDMVVLNDAPPLLYHRVLRDGQRILSRNLRATATREG